MPRRWMASGWQLRFSEGFVATMEPNLCEVEVASTRLVSAFSPHRQKRLPNTHEKAWADEAENEPSDEDEVVDVEEPDIDKGSDVA
eukprot:7185521-Pyramimonas_sp.AAC.1